MPGQENRQLVGYTDLILGNPQRMAKAVASLTQLRDLPPDDYDGIDIIGEPHWRVVTLTPAPREVRMAPRALQRVFIDMGVTPDDPIRVDVNVGQSDVEFAVTPYQMTSELVGVNFSSGSQRISVIVPDGQGGMRKIGYHSEGREALLSGRAMKVIRGYKIINDGVGPRGTTHPYLIEIFDAASVWMERLFNLRRIRT